MLFQDQTTGQTNDQATPPQTTEDWLAKVVETKGESFKDVQVLAKSKLESDTYIKNLESQLADLRKDLDQKDYAKELLDQLQNKAPVSTNGNPANLNSGTKTSDTKPELSEDLIKALVERTLTEKENSRTANQNAEVVRNELVSKYGTEAKAVVEKKALELGMTYKRLEEIASESPTAFFALVGEPKKDWKPLVTGSINTSAASMQAPSTRDWNYYQKMRKENPKIYRTPQVQQQLMKDKMVLGDKFGN